MITTVGDIDGHTIQEATLEVENQRVAILNYGCIVRRWQILDPSAANGDSFRDLILGFDSVEGYTGRSRHFGTLAGRVANRTRRGRFSMSGQDYQLSTNDGNHHLHGGSRGLGQRAWSMETDASRQIVRLTYLSPHGEEGYPGSVTFIVQFQLTESGLHCEMQGLPDSPTPINLAQHNYYNLDGRGDVLRHSLLLDADYYLPVDSELIPSGTLESVTDTRFDFRRAALLGERDAGRLGTDHTLVLSEQRDRSAPAAKLESSDGRISLELVTDQPGIQVYTAASMSIPGRGLEGQNYGSYAGVCLEAQHYPDALNHPHFPSIVCSPDHPYQQSLSLNLSVKH